MISLPPILLLCLPYTISNRLISNHMSSSADPQPPQIEVTISSSQYLSSHMQAPPALSPSIIVSHLSKTPSPSMTTCSARRAPSRLVRGFVIVGDYQVVCYASARYDKARMLFAMERTSAVLPDSTQRERSR